MFLRCARCGDRIGVYERLAVEEEPGSFVASSSHAVAKRRAGGDAGLRVLHTDCVPSGEPSSN